MLRIIALVMSYVVSIADIDALQSTAPRELTQETAREHLAAAHIAATLYNVDENLLLAIAWFESRYVPNVVGKLVKGKRACGALQTIPETTCEAVTLTENYLAGAKRLRIWIDAAHGRMNTAILGYAGGYDLINACALGPVWVVRAGQAVDLCTTPAIRLGRAKRIARARAQKNDV